MIFKYSKPLFSNPFKVFSCAGDEEIPTYVLDYKPDGGVYLKEKGVKPIYIMIQKAKANCELSTVLEQCVHENQLSVIAKSDVESAIADFTALSDYADIFTGVKQLGQIWKDIPLEVREQFNSSKSAFVSAIGSDDFEEKLSSGYDSYYKAIRGRLDNNTKLPDVIPSPEPVPEPAPDIIIDSK